MRISVKIIMLHPKLRDVEQGKFARYFRPLNLSLAAVTTGGLSD